MLTPKEIVRLDNPHYMTEQIHSYWHSVRDTELTEKQIELFRKVAYMTTKQQRKYVIIDDELVKAPTKQQNYILKQGKWQKTDQKHPTRYKY